MKTVANFDRIGEENAFAVLARATDLAARGQDIVNLGIGQPDFPTPAHIVEAAAKALRDGHHGYTPATGILPLREAVAGALQPKSTYPLADGLPELRAAIAAWIERRFGPALDPGTEVLPTLGSKEAIFHLAQVVGGDAVAYTEPDADAIAVALTALLDDPDRRAALGTAGHERSLEFTWAASAEAHLAAFRRALEP